MITAVSWGVHALFVSWGVRLLAVDWVSWLALGLASFNFAIWATVTLVLRRVRKTIEPYVLMLGMLDTTGQNNVAVSPQGTTSQHNTMISSPSPTDDKRYAESA